MRRWILRASAAVVLGVALSAASFAADPPAPTTPPPSAPPAAAAQPLPASAPMPAYDAYRAASPYNPTRIDRPVPDPALNMPNMTLPCDIPNQNLAPYTGGCGCGGGHGFLKGKHGGGCGGNGEGCCLGCSTLKQECRFMFGSCRQFFGPSW